MSSREANIEKLNYAITTLNEDAEGVHGLIEKSADELKEATEAGNRAAENAAKIIESLTPLAELMETQHRDSTEMLEEVKTASDEQRKVTSEQIEILKSTVGETLESVSTETKTACSELKETVEGSFNKLEKMQDETFGELQTKTLKEHERTRDELQTDILNYKNGTNARFDTLESELTKTVAKIESVSQELDGKIAKSADSVSKKLFVPILIAIGLGAADLVCLIMLLLK